MGIYMCKIKCHCTYVWPQGCAGVENVCCLRSPVPNPNKKITKSKHLPPPRKTNVHQVTSYYLRLHTKYLTLSVYFNVWLQCIKIAPCVTYKVLQQEQFDS